MGVFVGNFLGLGTVLIATGMGYPSLAITTQAFLGITYSFWLTFLVINLATRPKTDTCLCRTLEHEEQRIYRRYHVALDFPVAGHVYSGWLNFLRVAGAAFLPFLFTAGLIHRNNPWYYLGRQAAHGQPKAGAERALIERVFTIEDADRPSVDGPELA
jgi:hypothetical protein